MQRQLTKRIGELLMDMDGAPQAASSVAVNGRNVPMSYGQGDHHVRLSYVTPAEQMLLADVDMYNSDPPHRGPAGIPNFNDSGNGGGGGGGGGNGDGNGDADGDADGAFGGVGGEFGGLGGEAGVGTGDVGGAEGDSPVGGIGQDTSLGQVSVDPGFGSLGVDPGSTSAPGGVGGEFGPLGFEAGLGLGVGQFGGPLGESFQESLDREQAGGASTSGEAIGRGFDEPSPEADTEAAGGPTSETEAQGPPDPTGGLGELEANVQAAFDQQDALAGLAGQAALTFSIEELSREQQQNIGRTTTALNVIRNSAFPNDTTQEAIARGRAAAAAARNNPAVRSGRVANAALNDDEVAALTVANQVSLALDADLTDQNGNLTAAGLAVANSNFTQGGFGPLSPGGGFGGATSEVAQDFLSRTTDLTAVSPISIQDIAALNVSTATGFAVTDPQDTPQGRIAGNIFGRNNPTAANVVGGLAGLVSPAISAVSALSGQNTGILGLIGQAVPSLGISEGLTTAGQTISDVFGGVTGAIGAGFGELGLGPDGTSPDGGGVGPDGGGGVDGGGPPPTPTVPATPATPATPTVPETLDQLDLTLLPGVAQNLPPARGPTSPLSPFAQPTLPPVFTEQDARLLLQQTGQLPLAGIA
jgi:hypothetical protein